MESASNKQKWWFDYTDKDSRRVKTAGPFGTENEAYASMNDMIRNDNI